MELNSASLFAKQGKVFADKITIANHSNQIWLVISRQRMNCFFFFFFLRPQPRHMEVPRLGVESYLQPLAYSTAPAMRDPSHSCDLYHSSQQYRILNSLSEARDWTHILKDTSCVCFHWATTGTPEGWTVEGTPWVEMFAGAKSIHSLHADTVSLMLDLPIKAVAELNTVLWSHTN